MRLDKIKAEARRLGSALRQEYELSEITCIGGALACQAIGDLPLAERMVFLGALLHSIAACAKGFAK